MSRKPLIVLLLLLLLLFAAPSISFAADTVAPSISLNVPWISTKISKTPTFRVSWKAKDPAPSDGIASYTVRVRDARAGTWQDWRTDTTSTAGYFEGKVGRTYLFRALVKDNAGNQRWSKVRKTVVPFDQSQLLRARYGFARVYKSKDSRFFRGSLRYSTQPKTWISYRFYGDSIGLVSTKARNRGRAKIYIDGKHVQTIDAWANSFKPRQVIYYRTWKSRGTHFIKIENLATPGRPRFDIDALAIGNSSVPFALSGSGPQATRKFFLGRGLATFKLTHSGQSNFVVWLRNSKGERVELLANDIGASVAAAAAHIERDGQFLLEVDADGPWDVSIAQPRAEKNINVPVTLSGRGARVTRFIRLNKGLRRFELTHSGTSNFIVWLHDEHGRLIDLLTNEIGTFDGSHVTSIDRGAPYFLSISADGKWSVKIK